MYKAEGSPKYVTKVCYCKGLARPWTYQLPCSARLLDGFFPSPLPQLLGVEDRVNLTFLPPFLFITHGVQGAVVAGTEGYGPLVTHFAAHGPWLCKAKVMSVAW